jgi:hypothetical protein
MVCRISDLKAATSLNGMLLTISREAPRDLHFEGAWTESWTHRRCLHQHRTLKEAAECVSRQGPAWYVFAVQDGKPRQLTAPEERSLQEFRRLRDPLSHAHGQSGSDSHS